MPGNRLIITFVLMSLCGLMLTGCTVAPPKNPDNICSIFKEKPAWYKAAKKAHKRWGTPIQVMMAIMKHESSYREHVRPPRRKLLGFIPWTRGSSAYGYAQAQDSTWDWYRRDSGNGIADRDDFDDAIDFIGWYTHKSQQCCGISKWNTRQQYFAYHDGHGGYKRGTYKKKKWLLNTATRVENTASRYGAQLKSCEGDLDSGWWPF